jgi:hypothetical protein
MIQYFSYNFSTVENPLSDGGNFTTIPGYSALKAVAGNLCEGSSASTNCLMYYSGQILPADQYAEVTIPSLAIPGTDYVYLVVRQVPGAQTSYFLVLQGTTSSPSSQTATLYARVSGGLHSLGTQAITIAANDVIRLSISGNTLSISQNGSVLTSIVDGQYYINNGGYAGFGIFSSVLTATTVSLFAGGGPANPAVVQYSSGWQIGAFGTSLPAFANPVGAGDQIVVWVASIDNHGTCTGCTDNASGGSNTYTQVFTSNPSSGIYLYCFLATNTSAQTSLTITPTKSASGTYLVSCALDYQSAIAFTLDQANSQYAGSGTRNLYAQTTSTLAQAIEVAVTFYSETSNDNEQAVPNNGFTIRAFENGDPVLGEWFGSADKITAAITAISNPGYNVGTNLSGNCPVGIVLLYAATYSISGSAGVAGATVSYTGTSSGSTTADGSGNYTISGLSNGSYTITPSLTGYSFSPTNASETISGSSITGVNFTATHLTVATATFSPVAGTYQKTQTVTVSNSNSGLAGFAMYYTTDGSTPTTGSTPISNGGTVSISHNTTLKVLSVATGYINSIATGQFNIVQGTGDGLNYGYRFRF